ncbi:MAG: hypothetical protein WCF22_04800 [Candidatus Sulfotelmatobacter sp.]
MRLQRGSASNYNFTTNSAPYGHRIHVSINEVLAPFVVAKSPESGLLGFTA